jgi:hypothetical protein
MTEKEMDRIVARETRAKLVLAEKPMSFDDYLVELDHVHVIQARRRLVKRMLIQWLTWVICVVLALALSYAIVEGIK